MRNKIVLFLVVSITSLLSMTSVFAIELGKRKYESLPYALANGFLIFLFVCAIVSVLIKMKKKKDSGAGAKKMKSLSITVDDFINDLKNDNSYVRRDAAISLGEIKDSRSIEPLITALSDKEWYVQEYAIESLRKITGVDFGKDFVKWQEWWNQNKEEILKKQITQIVKVKMKMDSKKSAISGFVAFTLLEVIMISYGLILGKFAHLSTFRTPAAVITILLVVVIGVGFFGSLIGFIFSKIQRFFPPVNFYFQGACFFAVLHILFSLMLKSFKSYPIFDIIFSLILTFLSGIFFIWLYLRIDKSYKLKDLRLTV